MATMRYYGNVITTTIWRLYVTMETLWHQQNGGYALLWKRCGNNKTTNMAATRYYGNVMTDVFYIFNSTVVDWTCFFLSGALKPKSLQWFLGFVKSYVLLSFQKCVRWIHSSIAVLPRCSMTIFLFISGYKFHVYIYFIFCLNLLHYVNIFLLL